MHDLLFIHPNPKLQGLYKNHLKNYFNVDSAVDGLDGLRKFKIKKPQIVVSEYDLPLLSGISLLRFIRNQSQAVHIPFIFLSVQQPVADSLNSGANDWLVINDSTPDILVARCFQHLKSHAIKAY